MPRFVLENTDDIVEVVVVEGDEPYRFAGDISARQFAEQAEREQKALESSDFAAQADACAEFLQAVVHPDDRKRLADALNGKGERPIGFRRLTRIYQYLLGVYSGNPPAPVEPESPPSGPESTPTGSKVVSFSKGTVEVSAS